MIYRGKIKDIIFEFCPPDEKARGAIILCPGLPSVPKQKELISFLASQGFFVIFPRYKGVWESRGEFLKKSPAKDIEEIIKAIKNRKIAELYAGKKFDAKKLNIYLVGSSFGGAVALSLVKNKNISKIAALSPIVDLKNHNSENKEQDLIWLGKFIKRGFGEGYRFKNENWKKMASGKLFNPPQKIDPEKTKNILIIFDKLDKEIDYKKIENYAERNNIKTMELKNIGHLGFSKLSKKNMQNIIQWIES